MALEDSCRQACDFIRDSDEMIGTYLCTFKALYNQWPLNSERFPHSLFIKFTSLIFQELLDFPNMCGRGDLALRRNNRKKRFPD